MCKRSVIYDHTEAKDKDVSLIWTVDAFSWLRTFYQPNENLFSCLSLTKSISFSNPKIKQLISAVIRCCCQAETRTNAISVEYLILFCVFFFDLLHMSWVGLYFWLVTSQIHIQFDTNESDTWQIMNLFLIRNANKFLHKNRWTLVVKLI